ncbi:type II toxin-antitoxin system prevent-host-death family antitoxin [Allokutzneria sp. A3M-2-11 16]|uniref:type II toxin-antitoxin system Phd/YefM family antitoxin n=1 Tax=Allokutzneria sp. A3M-2-11 16 TaxID=2962043 RepID=UPI0020B89459|nr:type II toxin-antitoxin system prevent-host-death family antitoxin [Allokutzneria sp. A3M-2-11 16]MCP3797858.1 type II toxin-antitoxin system prevent-host-death family antitoxin [Allokutzneria sp. A3M-2-11 16]
MKVLTASEASRRFSAVLDEVEEGETIVVTRGGRRVALLSPAPRANGAELAALARRWAGRLDEGFAGDVAGARAGVGLDEDPWATA